MGGWLLSIEPNVTVELECWAGSGRVGVLNRKGLGWAGQAEVRWGGMGWRAEHHPTGRRAPLSCLIKKDGF